MHAQCEIIHMFHFPLGASRNILKNQVIKVPMLSKIMLNSTMYTLCP